MKFVKRSGAMLLCGLLAASATPGVLAFQTGNYAVQEAQNAQQTPQQLQQLVAPIALYPDSLIAQILAASEWPTQIVVAHRWLEEHSSLKGDALASAVNEQPWDSSVRAITQYPDVLADMDKNLSWTSALGDAYVNQPQAVMDAIQVMREKARGAGNLKTTPQERVTTQGQTIIIEPANPQIVYVPTYDPWLAYGAPIVAYPGWYPYGGLYVGTPGISFGISFGIGAFARYGWGWHHWGTDWHHHGLVYNHNTYITHGNTFFRHNSVYHSNTYNRSVVNNNVTNVYHNNSSYHSSGLSGYLNSRNHTTTGHTYSGHIGAFSGFNHGGTVQGYSTRGRASLGGSFHSATSHFGGSVGGGFHGSAGGGFHGGGFHGGGHR